MGVDEDRVLALAETFCGAALDPTRWTDAMKGLGAAIGAVGCALELTDLRSGVVSIQNTAPLDDDLSRKYEDHIFHQNPRIRRAVPLRLGAIADDSALIDYDDPASRPFLDWLEQSPMYYLIGAKVLNSDQKVGFLTANFTKQHGMATADHHRLFAALSPYVINAIAAAQALSKDALKGDLITLDALNTGRAFALLDSGGRVLECSSGFEALMRTQVSLRISSGLLVAAHPRDRAVVERFIGAVVGPRRLRGPPPPLRLFKAESSRGLALRALPLPPRLETFELFQPAALLTLTDLDLPRTVRHEDLMALFGLTLREAQVAALLGGGCSIEQTASMLEISEQTVRQHLKAIFGKMEVSRQAELVRVVSQLN